jgi:hypothetical protein
MGMNGDNKGLLFTILAIVGGIFVLSLILKIAFNLIGIIVVVGLLVIGFLFAQALMGKRR